jgi:hypothetical protein
MNSLSNVSFWNVITLKIKFILTSILQLKIFTCSLTFLWYTLVASLHSTLTNITSCLFAMLLPSRFKEIWLLSRQSPCILGGWWTFLMNSKEVSFYMHAYSRNIFPLWIWFLHLCVGYELCCDIVNTLDNMNFYGSLFH